MVNTRKKGYAAEKEVMDYNRSQGFVVYRPPATMYGTNDLFNLFDLLSKKKNSSVYAQIKNYSSPSVSSALLAQIADFACKYSSSSDSFELWIRHKAKWHGKGKNRIHREPFYRVYTIDGVSATSALFGSKIVETVDWKSYFIMGEIECSQMKKAVLESSTAATQ